VVSAAHAGQSRVLGRVSGMEIDPRGPRLRAVITTFVLAVVLITGSAWLLAVQVAVFAVGALAGLRYAPYGLLYRYLIRPRLGPPTRTEADLGGPLGEQATLVQFSTPFCAPCRPTRHILGQVAGMVDGVSHIEVDAAERLDLARRLRINSTPTVLVLGPDGAVAKRAVGVPRQADVIAALGSVIRPAAQAEAQVEAE